MKNKLSFLLLIFLLINISIPVFANGPGYIVDFTSQEGFNSFLANLDKDIFPIKTSTGTNYTPHGMYIEYMNENRKGLGEFRWTVDFEYNEADKCVTFTGKEEELVTKQKEDLRLSVYTEFIAADLPHVLICYRITDKAEISSNHIYLRDDRRNLEYSGVPGTWTPNELIADGQWNFRLLDLTEELSTIHKYCMGIRLPICKNPGDEFDLKFIACFAEKEDALNFDIATYDAYYAANKPETTIEPSPLPPEPEIPNTRSPLASFLYMAFAVVLVIGVFLIYRYFSKRI